MEYEEKCRPANPPSTEQRKVPEHRKPDSALPPLILVALDPVVVVAGERRDDVYIAEDVRAVGAMRETCPACPDTHLKLVPRQDDVRVAHLYCEQCTRCFDAFLADGSSVLNS